MTSLDEAGPTAGPAEGPAARPARMVGEPPVVLAKLLDDLIPGGRPLPRDEAVIALRRHFGRIQNRVQQAFEAHELSGLAAARWLAALTDTVMAGIHALYGSDAAAGQGREALGAGRDRRLRARRARAFSTSTCCS